jgi:hypothetical protein
MFTTTWGICFSLRSKPKAVKGYGFWHSSGTVRLRHSEAWPRGALPSRMRSYDPRRTTESTEGKPLEFKRDFVIARAHSEMPRCVREHWCRSQPIVITWGEFRTPVHWRLPTMGLRAGPSFFQWDSPASTTGAARSAKRLGGRPVAWT